MCMLPPPPLFPPPLLLQLLLHPALCQVPLGVSGLSPYVSVASTATTAVALLDILPGGMLNVIAGTVFTQNLIIRNFGTFTWDCGANSSWSLGDHASFENMQTGVVSILFSSTSTPAATIVGNPSIPALSNYGNWTVNLGPTAFTNITLSISNVSISNFATMLFVSGTQVTLSGAAALVQAAGTLTVEAGVVMRHTSALTILTVNGGTVLAAAGASLSPGAVVQTGGLLQPGPSAVGTSLILDSYTLNGTAGAAGLQIMVVNTTNYSRIQAATCNIQSLLVLDYASPTPVPPAGTFYSGVITCSTTVALALQPRFQLVPFTILSTGLNTTSGNCTSACGPQQRCNPFAGGCVCLPGYSGASCNATCTSGCDYGTCSAPGQCSCQSGYFGLTCGETLAAGCPCTPGCTTASALDYDEFATCNDSCIFPSATTGSSAGSGPTITPDVSSASLSTSATPTSTIVVAVIIPLLALLCVAGFVLGYLARGRRRRRRREEENAQPSRRSQPRETEIGLEDRGSSADKRASEAFPASAASASSAASERSSPSSITETLRHSITSKQIPAVTDVKLGNKLGAGNFADVYKATAWGSTMVAAKRLKSHEQVQEFLTEASILVKVRHPNCVQMLGIYEEVATNTWFIITEFLERGSLDYVLHSERETETLGPDMLIKMCCDAACGLQYLHQQGIVHRDLSARNLLVASDYKVKVSDFGMSRDLQAGYYVTDSKTMPVRWTAPEALELGKFSAASDVWSFGVTMWEIMSGGEVPYKGMSNREVVQAVDNGERLKKPGKCPDRLYDLMQRCWLPAKQRPSMAEVAEELRQLTLSSTSNAITSKGEEMGGSSGPGAFYSTSGQQPQEGAHYNNQTQ